MRNKATKKNMDLDLRRYGKMLYSKAANQGGEEGSGLTGNLLDDWANAVTQGEYTKYEDIPEANDTGVLTGWRRPTTKYDINYSPSSSPSCSAYIELSPDSYYTIVKDGTFYDSDIQV